jgi:hypothetical protein
MRLLLLLLAAACATPTMVRIRPGTRDLRGVTFLSYAASSADNFFDAQGRPCPGYDGAVRDYFAGWQSRDKEPICDHDTFQDGIRPAVLEMDFKGRIPSDGALELISSGYSVGAWGSVQARGSHYGDVVALTRVEIALRSPHCEGHWGQEVAKTAVSGPSIRGKEFFGWIEIPDLHLSGCKAGDPVEVALRLVAESNRGHIAIDAFGFSTSSADELKQIFALKPPQ